MKIISFLLSVICGLIAVIGGIASIEDGSVISGILFALGGVSASLGGIMILKGHTFAKILIWIGTAAFSAGALLSFDFQALCVSFFFAVSALCAWACDSPVQEESFRPSEILPPDALRAAHDFMIYIREHSAFLAYVFALLYVAGMNVANPFFWAAVVLRFRGYGDSLIKTSIWTLPLVNGVVAYLAVRHNLEYMLYLLGTVLENSSSFEEAGTNFAGVVVVVIVFAFIGGIISALFLNFVMNSAKMALHHEEKAFPRLAITALLAAGAIFFNDTALETFKVSYMVYPAFVRGIILSLSMAGHISAILSAALAWTDKKRAGKTHAAQSSAVRANPPAPKALPAENASDLVKQALQMISGGKFSEASSYLDRAYAINPRMPNIYIGRLMIKTRTRNAQELVKSSVNLEQEELFAKALQYSGEKAKEILSKYIHINRRANSRA